MKRMLIAAALSAAVVTGVAASACSSTSSSSVAPVTSFTPLPVLVPGSRLTYSGKFSETITYESPSPQQPNSDAAYKTIDVQTISNAPSGAPAPFKVHRDFRYAVTSLPTSGIQIQHRVIDAYESSTVTASSQTIAQPEFTTTTTGIDQTANRVEGNGPYAYQSAVTTVFASPRVLLVFPLVGGTTAVPLARTVMDAESSKNPAGIIYSSRNTTARYINAGAYIERGSIGPGETTDVSARPNGTANLSNTGTATLHETIGLPLLGSSHAYQIPVARVEQGVAHSYLAADWYPGEAAPPSPLAATTQTVQGSSAVPASCGVRVSVTNPQEVDTSSTNLNVVAGIYTIGTTREFLSNGTTVCRMTSATTRSYSVETGLPISTTVDSFEEGLTAESGL
ncbi:MAG: hypothetical protein JO104_03165 [Candidatus Eremiobacteraeota bacterium]|nr:hypothetical protein [Candidatus Eremiobacteraeota bacterium]